MKIVEPLEPNFPTLELTPEGLTQLVTALGVEEANVLLERRNEKIRLSYEDPLNHGIYLDHWKAVSNMLLERDQILLSGGNRSSKTHFSIGYVVDCLVNGKPWIEDQEERSRTNKDLVIACFHSSSMSSIVQQQYGIYQFLPPDLRDYGKGKGKDKHSNISFLRKSGFSNNSFILPNGNMCLFFNYNQDSDDIGQGYEYDLIWADELIPLQMVEDLEMRLVSKSGKFLISFAPVTGHTPTVAKFQDGSTITSSKKADPDLFPDLVDRKGKLPVLVNGCPKGEMPYTADCRNPDHGIVYFHSEMNPFNPYENIKSKCHGRPSDYVKMRAYGYAGSSDSGAFPKFGKHHIITKERYNEIRMLPGSRYCVADPAGSKAWFIKWYYMTQDNEVVMYREWPSFQEWGEWAMPPKGKKGADGGVAKDYAIGPAQRAGGGMGTEAYKQLILGLEGWVFDEEKGEWDGTGAENISERIIDARFSKQAPGGEGTSILELFDATQYDQQGRVSGPSMVWLQAQGNGAAGGLNPTEIGVQMVNDYFEYNPERDVDAMNHPRWYVLDDCKQSIYAYQLFSGRGSEKCALKDVIDPDRYLVSTVGKWLDNSAFECVGGGSY